MLKLDQNYSDYTDETDENYPEGKAINASSSESANGTPLLAEFMNDINAAHIAMYEKAYGSRNGISGVADTQKMSQFADAVVKLVIDKIKAHADLRGLVDGVHGATSEASSGQIASRDEFGNLKVGTAIDDEDAINLGGVKQKIVDANLKEAAHRDVDEVPAVGSSNLITSGAVAQLPRFPDYSQQISIPIGVTEWTATEDCYIVYSFIAGSDTDRKRFYINNHDVGVGSYTSSGFYVYNFTGFAKKNDVIKSHYLSIKEASLVKIFKLK